VAVDPVIRSLPILVLDVHDRCNCRCVMCDIWKRDAAREMDPDDLTRHLPAIEQLRVRWVVLTGGEPLMHSRLFSLCAPLRKLGIRITLLTTGLLLSRFGEDVAREIDDVIVSLDGPRAIHDRIRRVPNAFQHLGGGIRELRSFNPTFAISARSTVQRGNAFHLRETVCAARELGCDSISFLATDIHSAAFNRSEGSFPESTRDLILRGDELDGFSLEVEKLIDSGDCGGYVTESAGKMRRIVDHFRWYLGIGAPEAPACNAPWVSAVMDASGAVRPCFFHPPIGTASSGLALDAVLNGPQAVAFRSSLRVADNEICRKCVCSLNWQA
jgi:MoaA/NifB/PqqE/SkfB family radical SAM enzyme